MRLFSYQYSIVAVQSWETKKILYMGLRATLDFGKFKVALNPKYRIFLNFA